MGNPNPFSLQVRADDASLVVEICGEVDVVTAPALHDCLAAAIETTGGEIVVDCSGLAFIDSSGLKELIEAHASPRNSSRQLYLDGVGLHLMRLLRISGLDRHIPVRSEAPAH